MALPVIDTTYHTTELPSTGETIRFRPYRVLEEKILLTASETDNTSEIMQAVLQVISNCLEDRSFNTKKFTVYDVCWLWVQLSAKTINNVYKITYLHDEDHVKIELDLNEVFVDRPKEVVSDTFMIDEKIGVKFKRMNFQENIKMASEDLTIDAVLKKSIVYVFDKDNEDEVFSFEDSNQEEIDAFINSLSIKTMEHFKDFLENEPKIIYRRTKMHEGQEIEIELEGLADFFQLG